MSSLIKLSQILTEPNSLSSNWKNNLFVHCKPSTPQQYFTVLLHYCFVSCFSYTCITLLSHLNHPKVPAHQMVTASGQDDTQSASPVFRRAKSSLKWVSLRKFSEAIANYIKASTICNCMCYLLISTSEEASLFIVIQTNWNKSIWK